MAVNPAENFLNHTRQIFICRLWLTAANNYAIIANRKLGTESCPSG